MTTSSCIIKFTFCNEDSTVAQKGQTQIIIQKHKSIFKNTNQYSKTQTQEPKHAPKLKTQVSGMVMNSADFTAKD